MLELEKEVKVANKEAKGEDADRFLVPRRLVVRLLDWALLWADTLAGEAVAMTSLEQANAPAEMAAIIELAETGGTKWRVSRTRLMLDEPRSWSR